MFLKQSIRLITYYLLWLIYFTAAKAIFLAYNSGLTGELSGQEIWDIFRYGLIMDVSTAGYLMVFPALLTVFRLLLPAQLINRTMFVYTIIISLIISCLQTIDLGLYPHWGTRLNFTFIHYLKDPASLQATITLKEALPAIILTILLTAFPVLLYRKFLPAGIVLQDKTRWYIVPIQILLTASLIIPIRGGFDTSPLNHSSVAFSSKLYANQAATNYLWNFFKSCLKRKVFSNPCTYFSKEESMRLFEAERQKDTYLSPRKLIKQNPVNQPNVILVILESFTNKAIASLGGVPGITPQLDSLISRSIVFTDFYAAGNRSDRGMSAIIAGYPALLETSIMLHPEKMQSLTLLPEYFNRRGYHTSFYYGGDINFYNLKTLVLQSGYQQITSKDNFPADLGRMTKWGVPDGYLFERVADDLKKIQQPFMQTIYTLSSHHPFDVPYTKIHGHTQEQKFLNSVAYTDSCLGSFIRQFRESDLWDNTLLVVTADHGALDPGPTSITDPATYRIPLIWSGGVANGPQRIETITQQIDLGPTLVSQLGWEHDKTPFARNFFSSNPYAFYTHNDGWGYITGEGISIFNQTTNSYTRTPYSNASDLNFPKAYIQVLHEDFINR